MASTLSNGVSVEDFGALKANVEHLSEAVQGIRQSIGGLHAKLDERQKTPWSAIGAGIGFLAFIGIFLLFGFNAYVGSIRDAQDRTQVQIDRLAEITVPRAELEDRRSISGQRTERIESDIQRLNEGIVPRGEHEERWRSFAAEDTNLQRQIDQTNTKIDSLIPASGVIESLADRLDRLERIRLMRPDDQGTIGR